MRPAGEHSRDPKSRGGSASFRSANASRTVSTISLSSATGGPSCALKARASARGKPAQGRHRPTPWLRRVSLRRRPQTQGAPACELHPRKEPTSSHCHVDAPGWTVPTLPVPGPRRRHAVYRHRASQASRASLAGLEGPRRRPTADRPKTMLPTTTIPPSSWTRLTCSPRRTTAKRTARNDCRYW